MADTTQANVLAIAPALDDVSQDAWDIVLTDVADMISEAAWGAKQEIAQRYLAAHKLTMIAVSDSGPAVTAEKTGDVSTSYAVGGGGDDDLAETKHGREFKRIQRGAIAGFMVVTP